MNTVTQSSAATSFSKSQVSIKSESRESTPVSQDQEIVSIVSGITRKCSNLDDVLYFRIYFLKLSKVLKNYGYTQSIEYAKSKDRSPLDSEFEEKILMSVLKATIKPNILCGAKNRSSGYSSKSVGILASLEGIYQTEKNNEVKELRRLMRTARLLRLPFGQKIYFNKFENVYKKVSDLELFDSISEDEIKRYAYLGIRQSSYSQWALDYEFRNGCNSSNAYQSFSSLKEMKKKVGFFRSLDRVNWFFIVVFLLALFVVGVIVGVVVYKQEHHNSYKSGKSVNHSDGENDYQDGCKWFYDCDDTNSKCEWSYTCDDEVMVQSSA